MKIKKKIIVFCFELLSFANLDIENYISQKLTARSFKLAQLIEDNE